MKWFLISEDDMKIVRKALFAAWRFSEVDSGTEKFHKDALNTFNTGLHVTDAVPADFQQAETEDVPNA